MPLGAIGRARSGVKLAETQVAAAAQNTANLQTEGYHRVRASGVETAEGGVRVELSRAAESGAEPVGDVLTLKQGSALYRANLAVVDTADKMLGQAVDILG